ncbi:MAG: transcriptional regulator [Legionellales bacterium]|jgi:DNA-binding NtrC family response regulator|nr:transcriptional regulator [Legionellales bacterium]|tara:strand:+ start:480 stop:1838 length:1359 start_codon:yes stop_codon:yes gene_type:complete
MSKRHILVVDDEPDIRNLVQEILEDEGFSVSVAENATIARQSITKTRPDLILLDIWMPDIDGITLLKEWKNSFGQKTPIIMMSGHGNVETAVEATRNGAYDFIEKPLSTAKLLLTIKHALETYSLKSENLKLNQITMSKLEPIGKSKVINNLKSQLSQIAKHDAYVLMRGESGTNKELLARYLHSLSSRSDKPFLTVNISTLNSENPQKELFGFVENDQTQEGLLDNAAEGTLFINDIGELSTNLQSYFLDVLKTKQYTRIGGSKPINLNIRVVAATRYDIELLIKEGVFIDELYYLMNVLPINIPSLHEHFEDIPELLEYYVNQFIEFESLPYRKFSVSAQNRLRSYKWPGNESELKNLVQRLLIMGTEEIINVDEIESYLKKSEVHEKQYNTEIFNLDLPLRDARENFEKAYLMYQLEKANGNVSKLANEIGIERTHLYRKLKTLGINLK